MRIAYDYQAFSLQSYGGISRYFTCLAQGLIDLQQQVQVFAPLHRNRYVGALPSGVVNGREFIKFPPQSKGLFAIYNQVVTRKKITNWQPNIVHETYYSRFGSAPKNCPIVITVHDMIHELYKDNFSKKDETIAIKKIAIERADHVICISENTKNDLLRLYDIATNKITVVYHGFDQFAKADQNHDDISISDKPFLLYVGGRWGYKNFSGFIKAVASSKKLMSDFDIISFGVSKFCKSELSLIEALGFAKNQVRHVSGNDVLLGKFYRAARAFVYPSLYEGFGIPPLEAMAHHCPVISSNSSSMPEVIGSAAEFFNPSSHEDMRNAIEAVVYCESRIDDLKKRGIERLDHFSWDKCTYQTLNVYQSLLGEAK
jgi:glycosyltransferase involved in cell wall biosynthesis